MYAYMYSPVCMTLWILHCHSDGRLEQVQTITHTHIYSCSQLGKSQPVLDIEVRHDKSCSQMCATSNYTAGDDGDNTSYTI